MRATFIILIIIHGLIHLIGFSHAFGFTNSKLLAQPVSRTLGIIWLLACLLIILAGILYLLKIEFWWIAGFIALVVSQILIIIFWQDAKFGTIPNTVLLITAIISYGYFNFNKNVNVEVNRLLTNQTFEEKLILTQENMTHLPKPVKRWLEHSGIIGKEDIHTVYLKQKVLLKMKPEQKNWTKATAQQYFTTKKPSFIWTVKMQLIPLIGIVGRDKFEEGKGEMLIKLFSFFPILNSKNNTKINEGTIQRYLGEIVWFPSAALSSNISWEGIDNYSAKAVMTCKGTTGKGVFYFDKDGNFKKYSAMRYMGGGENAELKEWTITVLENKVMNGIRIPVKMEANWKLDTCVWTWLEIELTEVNYNI